MVNWEIFLNIIINIYLGGFSSLSAQVERPQNGVKSHDLPGSKVAHCVEAKHIPGKSIILKIYIKLQKSCNYSRYFYINEFSITN